jgi:multisubunit Na+/H+ antiporter MnhG subunit
MAGSVLFGVLFVIVVVVIAIGMISPFWLVPLVVIGLGLVLLTPLLGKLRGSAIAQPDAGPQGVPTTREASYEPVRDPTEQRP